MRFMQELIATLKSPPAFLKMPKKRGTFFARKPRSGAPPEPDVVKLLRGLDLSLQATPIGEQNQLQPQMQYNHVCWSACSASPDDTLTHLELCWQCSADIMHWTADVNDPSCGVTVSIADVQYAHRLRLNQPLPPQAAARLPKCV